ncbi:MAG: cupin domain-containing protein [Sandaracinaceae bacterium]
MTAHLFHPRRARIAIATWALLASACGASQCPPASSADAPSEPPAAASVPAEVRALTDAERRRAPNGTATIAMLAQGDNAFVARLEMDPGAAVPEHQDADEEYIHVLEGHGTIWIDGVESDVQPGATIFMPGGSTVRYQNGDARMVAIQVFAGPASAAKYQRWTVIDPAGALETSGEGDGG